MNLTIGQLILRSAKHLQKKKACARVREQLPRPTKNNDCTPMNRMTSIALAIALLELNACKLEPIGRMGPSDPAPKKQWLPQTYVIPDQRPQSEAARELASHLVRTFDALASLEGNASLPDSESPRTRYLTQSFGQANLAPDGDNRGWTQAVPLRRLKNEAWSMSMFVEPPAPKVRARRRAPKTNAALPPQTLEQSSKDWIFRQFRDTGGVPETFSMIRLTPTMLATPQKYKAQAHGKFVLLDATQSERGPLRDQLLQRNSNWFSQLSQLGAVGCMVFTSLRAEDGLWLELQSEFARPFTELLAPGEAPPARVELLAVGNANASRDLANWHGGGSVGELGPERKGQRPPSRMQMSPPDAVDKGGRVKVTMRGNVTWETQYSVLGRQPGILRPEKAILVLARWSPNTSKTNALQDRLNDAALTAMLGLMRRTHEWHKQGRRTDISIMYGALYAGQDAIDAGLSQFLRQKTVRTENIRAVVWLEDFSTRNDAIDLAVRSNPLPEGWPQLLELYGGHHLQLSPPLPLRPSDPLQNLEALNIPVLTFTQRPWLSEPKNTPDPARPTFIPMAEQIEKILQFTWTITEGQEEPSSAAPGANPDP